MVRTQIALLIGMITACGFAQSVSASVYISEFVASNATGLQDETGDRPDWIEIHNDGSEGVNLLGWKLSDGSPKNEPWVFPDHVLEADAYLVVFASGNSRRESPPFHTDFELKRDGESLILLKPDGIIASSHQLPTPYPEQYTDIAYGLTTNAYRYLSPPTPGSSNQSARAFEGVLPSPKLSHEAGWFTEPFSVTVLNLPSDAQAYYTLNGVEPTSETGTPYTKPIDISTTTALRIRLTKPGYLAQEASTFTFLNESDVLTQSAPPDYPEFWTENIPADYAMDEAITDHADYRALMLPALKALPVISLVTDPKNLFNEDTGIYMNTEKDGSDWERPVSMEYLGANAFQVNAAIRIQGRSSRQPRTSPKHSFRILFKHPYGSSKLQHPVFDSDTDDAEYNTLVLRATSNHSWTYPLAEQRERAQYLRDPWVKETQRAMGHLVPRTKFTHLFLNGLYWGIYVITERPDDAFMAQHFGGKRSHYDVIKGGEVVAGTNRIWRRLFTLANQGLEDPVRYEEMVHYIDLDSFIDFMILNHFIGNETWDFGNWYAARLNEDGEKFRFFCWDAETSMNRVNENRIFARNTDRPTALFQALRKNESFQKRFSERVQMHTTDSGALTPENNVERYKLLAEKIELAVIAESARWGDYRLTTHRYRTAPFERYTRNDHWYAEQQRILDQYFPQRTEIVVNQYRSINLSE